MLALGIVLLAGLSATSAELELLDQARLCLRAGDRKRAAALAEAAARSARGDIERTLPIHREAQDILMAAGRGADLVAFYDGLLRKNVSDPRRRYLRARVDPDPARRRNDLEAVLAASPDLFWAAYDLAGVHAGEGDWSRAARQAERAVTIRPEEAAAWNVLGHLRLEASRFIDDPSGRRVLARRAREALRKAVELDPRLAEAHYNLGLVDFALGEAASAKESWEKAVELTPRFAEALNALGHLAAREGRDDEAMALCEKAIAARPDYGSAHNNLAVACYRRKDHARATKHLALAEAAGFEPAPSFKRVLVRAIEEEEFRRFQKAFARARSKGVSVFRSGDERPVDASELDRRALAAAILRMTFRDSHGGVRLGERRVGGAVVARYVEAGRVEVELGPREKRALIVVVRESASGPRRRLASWVADAGYRFSAEARDVVKLVARLAGLAETDEGAPDG